MGLYVHSLLELPIEAKRSYYIYLLDYGWSEPLGDALISNFEKMSQLASENDAIVIRSTNPKVHFYDEVFSYHNINGEDGEKLLPAILITDRHPKEFKESFGPDENRIDRKFRIILFPLREYCKTTTDVALYIDKIFKDVIQKKDLSDFAIKKEMRPNIGKALVTGFILQPNWNGIGFDFKEFFKQFRK